MKAFIKPVLVLAILCLLVASALAVTNEQTLPIIEAAANQKAELAKKAVLADADSFTEMNLAELPKTVTKVYSADNGAGFVFMLTAKGYGGDMKLICGMDADGKITACDTLSQSETQGLGTKTMLPPFKEQFIGQDASLSAVDSISGATISSKAYINAVKDAFTAYALAKEAA